MVRDQFCVMTQGQAGRVASWIVDGDNVALASRDMVEAESVEGKVGAGTALVLIVGLNVFTLGEGKAITKGGQVAGKELVAVYRIVENGTTVYVGITNDLRRRAIEHGVKELEPIIKNLPRYQARAVEQALILHHKLSKHGGTLRNKINTISPTKNPLKYQLAVTYGRMALRMAGGPF